MLHFTFDMPFSLMCLYGSIMIALVLLLRILLGNRLPKYVFPVLWALVLVRLLIPFSLSSPLSAPVPSLPESISGPSLRLVEDIALEDSTDVLKGTAGNTIHSTAQKTTYSLGRFRNDSPAFIPNPFFALRFLFLSGLAVVTGFLLSYRFQYSKKLKHRLLLEHNEIINEILRDMGMGHILVFSCDEIASPMACGLIRPYICLPTCMDFGNTELLRHIFAHETMHIKRKDNYVKTAMLIAICLNWYNPLIWIMSKCLSADLEAACDASVLRQFDEDCRKSYAASLLAMAVTGNRTTLLYSAFSKTEVERRIRSVLNYRKSGVMAVLFSVLFLSLGTVAFATGGQAPYSSDLSSSCFSSSCRWSAKAGLTRNIATGENAQKRADTAILNVLSTDTTNDSLLLEQSIQKALAEEFHVEPSAFRISLTLHLDEEEREAELQQWELEKGEDGFYLYKGEPVRTFLDTLGDSDFHYQCRPEGNYDITVIRDRFGQISSLRVLQAGDSEFDRRTQEIEQERMLFLPSPESTEVTYGTNVAESYY